MYSKVIFLTQWAFQHIEIHSHWSQEKTETRRYDLVVSQENRFLFKSDPCLAGLFWGGLMLPLSVNQENRITTKSNFLQDLAWMVWPETYWVALLLGFQTSSAVFFLCLSTFQIVQPFPGRATGCADRTSVDLSSHQVLLKLLLSFHT